MTEYVRSQTRFRLEPGEQNIVGPFKMRGVTARRLDRGGARRGGLYVTNRRVAFCTYTWRSALMGVFRTFLAPRKVLFDLPLSEITGASSERKGGLLATLTINTGGGAWQIGGGMAAKTANEIANYLRR